MRREGCREREGGGCLYEYIGRYVIKLSGTFHKLAFSSNVVSRMIDLWGKYIVKSLLLK
jgi:hypothetical protein